MILPYTYILGDAYGIHIRHAHIHTYILGGAGPFDIDVHIHTR